MCTQTKTKQCSWQGKIVIVLIQLSYSDTVQMKPAVIIRIAVQALMIHKNKTSLGITEKWPQEC